MLPQQEHRLLLPFLEYLLDFLLLQCLVKLVTEPRKSNNRIQYLQIIKVLFILCLIKLLGLFYSLNLLHKRLDHFLVSFSQIEFCCL